MDNEDKVRDAILSAAKELFGRHGYRKTTMDDIARKAGKAKSSLYYYFKDKDEVLVQTAHREVRELYVEIGRAMAACPTLPEKFEAFIMTRYRFFLERRSLYYQVVLEIRALWTWEMFFRLRQYYRKEEVEQLVSLFELGKKTGEVIERSTEEYTALAEVISAALVGIEMNLLFSPEPPPPMESEMYFRKLIGIFLTGIFK